MLQKRILIISRSFYPFYSPRSIRTTELVKEFSRQGHSVTLLTHKNDEVHKGFEDEFNITIKDLGKPVLPVIKVKKDKGFVNILKRIIRRILMLFIEYPDIELMFLVKRALRNEKNYDLLLSIAVPHTTHWGVANVWRYKDKIAKTWIADCGDPYMGATSDSFKKLFYFKYIEKWWCRKADYISVPFKGAIKAYYKEFHHKVRVIPQGFNFTENMVKNNNYNPHTIPTFAYAGLLIPNSRDPRLFIEYLLSLNIEFKFIIYSRQKEMISDLIERSKGMIVIKDYIDRKELIQTLSGMDFIINFNNVVTTQLPSKLIDYYFSNRPVLSIESFNLDIKTIDQFLSGNYKNRHLYFEMEQYEIKNVCNQFLSLCNH